MQDLHLQTQNFSQARHPAKTREINGTETPHTDDVFQRSHEIVDFHPEVSRFFHREVSHL